MNKTLAQLAKQHGPLGDRLLQIRKPQQEEIANAAYEEGVINAMTLLEVPPLAMFRVMNDAGYAQCAGCEEWFGKLELEPEEDPEFLEMGDQERLLCEECKLAQDGEWAAPAPPEPTTPEEIAAAEEKKRKAREAVIRQEERAAKRQEIMDAYADARDDPTAS